MSADPGSNVPRLNPAVLLGPPFCCVSLPPSPSSLFPIDVEEDEGLTLGGMLGIICGSLVGGVLLIVLGMSSTDCFVN